MCVRVCDGDRPKVAGVYSWGRGERGTGAARAEGTPDLRERGLFVFGIPFPVNHLPPSTLRGSGRPLAPHLVRGSLLFEVWTMWWEAEISEHHVCHYGGMVISLTAFFVSQRASEPSDQRCVW